MKRRPSLIALAVALIGPCVGANVVLFSLADGFLFRSLPYGDPSRLVVVQQRSRERGTEFATISIAERDALRHQPEIESVTGYTAATETVSVSLQGGDVVRLRLASVDRAFLETLAVSTAGTGLREDGSSPVAIALTHRTALILAGNTVDAIGQTVRTRDGRSFVVSAVLPDRFVYPLFAVGPQPDGLVVARERKELAGSDRVFSIARVRSGVSDQGLKAAFDRASAEAASSFPTLRNAELRGKGLLKGLLAGYRPLLWSMLGVSGVVVLAASATFGIMLFDWTVRRKRELSCRLALGATHHGVAMQLFLEGIVLVGMALLPAVVAGAFVVDYVRPRLPELVFRTLAHEVDRRTLLMSLSVTVMMGIVSSIFPVARVLRAKDFRRQSGSLVEDGRSGGRVVFGSLLALQIAAAVVVLGGLFRVASTVNNFANTRLGLDPAGVFTVNFAVRSDQTPEARYARLLEAMDRIRSVDGVLGVGASQALPLAGMEPDGVLDSGNVAAHLWRTTGAYFSAAGIPILEGREFDKLDRPNSSAIVSKLYATTNWPGQSAIGKVIHLGETKLTAVVVGVVGDTRQRFDQPIMPAVYVLYEPNQFQPLPLLVRTRLPEGQARLALHNAINFDEMARRPEIGSLKDRIDRALVTQKFQLLVMQLWAVVAISLASMGTFVVSTRIVFRRWREFAIRNALGETPIGSMRRMASEIGLAWLPGVAVGLITLFFADRLLGSLVAGMLPTSYRIYFLAAAAAAIITIISVLPAMWRLSQINVASILRRLD